jgi:hypothetical protein
MHPQNNTSAAKSLYNRSYYARNRERLLALQNARYRYTPRTLGPIAPALPGEEWCPVVGYEGWYEVSSFGRVRRVRGRSHGTRPGYLLKPSHHRSPYLSVSLSREGRTQTIRVHRLVAEAFLGSPAGRQVNHKSGIKADNRLVNLEWVTSSRNMHHAYATGLRTPTPPPRLRGEQHPESKLTESAVRTIRASRGQVQQAELGRQFGVSQSHISEVQAGKCWRHVRQ